jgi:hypothetical protein
VFFVTWWKLVYPSIKQSTQRKGRKTYKMERTQDNKQRIPQREWIARGTSTNQSTQTLESWETTSNKEACNTLKKWQHRKTLTYNKQILLLMKQIHEEKQTSLRCKSRYFHTMMMMTREPCPFRQCIWAGNQNIGWFLKLCTFILTCTQIWLIPRVDDC